MSFTYLVLMTLTHFKVTGIWKKAVVIVDIVPFLLHVILVLLLALLVLHGHQVSDVVFWGGKCLFLMFIFCIFCRSN